jgi:hypothetical protein
VPGTIDQKEKGETSEKIVTLSLNELDKAHQKGAIVIIKPITITKYQA